MFAFRLLFRLLSRWEYRLLKAFDLEDDSIPKIQPTQASKELVEMKESTNLQTVTEDLLKSYEGPIPQQEIDKVGNLAVQIVKQRQKVKSQPLHKIEKPQQQVLLPITPKISKEKQKRILDIAVETQEISAKEANSLAFMAKHFIQTTLPHRDPGDVEEWHRKNGNVTLLIRPGFSEDKETETFKSIGIPYGVIPRLLLIWMATEAKRTGKRTLKLGENLSEFMRALGLDPRSGINIARLKDQMRKLFKAIITLDETIRNEGKIQNTWASIQLVVRGSMSWIDDASPLFNSLENDEIVSGDWIELSDIFFKSISEYSVPLDMRIIQEIQQSPLALDLYMWMIHRTFSTDSSNTKASFASYKQIHDQFGANYKNIKDFKKELKPILKTIKAASNNLCLEETDGGLKISKKFTLIK